MALKKDEAKLPDGLYSGGPFRIVNNPDGTVQVWMQIINRPYFILINPAADITKGWLKDVSFPQPPPADPPKGDSSGGNS